MKVFVSWSGDLSHKVAVAFRDWLPDMIQSVKPFVSSEDIYTGSRWAADVAKELADTNYGILCLTAENLDSRWLNFEAGALSKIIEHSSVSPFLFDLRISSLEGPLAQFQSVVNDEENIFKMVSSINNKEQPGLQRGPEKLRKHFEVWWPHLKAKLDEIAKQKPTKVSVEVPTRKQAEILEELVGLVRQQQSELSTRFLRETDEQRQALSLQDSLLRDLMGTVLSLRQSLISVLGGSPEQWASGVSSKEVVRPRKRGVSSLRPPVGKRWDEDDRK
jgi:hypothetical protein